MRIYLTGFMGSGKSTVGRLLAEKLAVPFVDLDREIEHRLSHSVTEVFGARGESYFRDEESALLKSFQTDPMVMATGGGCFIDNQEWMLRNGTVIFLDLPFTDIVGRIGGDPARPLWKNAEKLYSERSDDYKKANFTVDASGTVEEVVDMIRALPLPEPKKTPES